MATRAEPISKALRPVPDVRIDFDVDTPMRDGTILRSDIFRPAGDKPVPVILQRTPYDKRVTHGSHMMLDVRTMTAAGYAVVVQDVRGRFASEGQFLITPTQEVEGPDGYDTIEWLAAQPWCSGAIGMIGASYCSLTQLMAAVERPPHLKAILLEKTGTPARGAVLLDSIMISWCAGQALDWLQKAMLRQEAGEKEAAIINDVLKDPQKAAHFLPLNDMPLRKIGSLPSWQEMIDLFHSQNAIDVETIDVPALVVSGWYDMATTETARIYGQLLETAAGRRETSIIFGPWEHGSAGPALGEVAFSPFAQARLAGVPADYLAFYDRHLKGDSSTPALGAKYFLMGANEWKKTPAWPPAHKAATVYLASSGHANSVDGDGCLATARDGNGRPDSYRYDPLDPAPSIGGRFFEAGGSRAGPFDQRRVEQRKDVLVYTGEVLKSDLEIAGPVRLRVFMTCSTPDTDLVVKLCDVRPNGISYNILDEYFRCRWREGYDKTVLFEKGKIYEMNIDMGPVAHRFRAGHRLRFTLTSSAFPHFDRNMNTGNPIGTDAKGLVAEVTILHDAAHPSALTLPVTPA
jgi:putative CocE/NonD family hydrolase